MSNPRLLETVAAELHRQGLPAAEIGRLLQELEDHVADLFAEQGGRMDELMPVQERIEARLGRPEALVAAALANRRSASVFGRHPILSFVVAPIPVAILSWVGFGCICFGLLELLRAVLGEEYLSRAARDFPAVLVYLLDAMVTGMRFLPPAVATALLCWCARRAGLSWRWTLIASGLVALVAGALVVQVTPAVEPEKGKLLLGLGFPVRQWINLIQLLVPLAVGAAFVWGTRHRAVLKA